MKGLEVEGLTVRVGAGQHAFRAVDEVSFAIEQGHVLGLVGESWSGKSCLARALVGLMPIASGNVAVDGRQISLLSRRERRRLLRRVQLIFQDPYSSLNPRMTVRAALIEALSCRLENPPEPTDQVISELLATVGLDEGHGGVLPARLSGGERQRVAIARALAVEPSVLIADEITSSLDVSIQAQILNLLADIIRTRSLTVLFISHNLAVVRLVSDTIAVMVSGSVVEAAPTDQLISDPRHPYTRALLASLPESGAKVTEAPVELLIGEPPDPWNLPSGCRLQSRCPIGPAVLSGREMCREVDPRVDAPRRPHATACHFADEVPTSSLSRTLAQTASRRRGE
jgi:peptide/nickel transport system ATP-binding protein